MVAKLCFNPRLTKVVCFGLLSSVFLCNQIFGTIGLCRDLKQPACLKMLPKDVYSCVIVGGGIGGLTSAIYLSQLGCNTLVLQGNQQGGALAAANSVQNWPGEIKINGLVLIKKLEKHAKHYGALLEAKELNSVDFSKRPFELVLKESGSGQKQTIYALSCIISTGATPLKLNVPGEAEFWGRGVSNCAICDGPLYKDKTLAVVGSSDKALSQVEILSLFAKKIYLIEKAEKLENFGLRALNVKNNPKVEIMLSTSIEKIYGDSGGINCLEINSKLYGTKNINVSGVFVMLGSKPNSEIFKDQLKVDQNGFIKLIYGQSTSIPGVFAVGEVCSEKYWQAIAAAGQGCVAALQVFDFLPNKISISEIGEQSKPPLKIKEDLIIKKNKIIEIEHYSEINSDFIHEKKAYVIFFSSNWCWPCKSMNSAIEELVELFVDDIVFYKSNVSKNTEIAFKFGVSATPTLILFSKNNKVFKQFVGSQPKDTLKGAFEQLLELVED